MTSRAPCWVAGAGARQPCSDVSSIIVVGLDSFYHSASPCARIFDSLSHGPPRVLSESTSGLTQTRRFLLVGAALIHLNTSAASMIHRDALTTAHKIPPRPAGAAAVGPTAGGAARLIVAGESRAALA